METRDVLIPLGNSTQSGIGKTRLAKLKLPPGEHQLLLTKGDNNHADDIELYQSLDWFERRHIVGKVRGYVFFTLFFFVPYFFTIPDLIPCRLPYVSPWYITIYDSWLYLLPYSIFQSQHPIDSHFTPHFCHISAT